MQRKGQFTIIALLMTTLMIIVYAAFLPIINDGIASALPYVSAPTRLLLELIPFAIAAVIIAGIFTYGQPRY